MGLKCRQTNYCLFFPFLGPRFHFNPAEHFHLLGFGGLVQLRRLKQEGNIEGKMKLQEASDSKLNEMKKGWLGVLSSSSTLGGNKVGASPITSLFGWFSGRLTSYVDLISKLVPIVNFQHT